VGDGLSCADVNECGTDTDDCDENATCTNEPGSFACACNAGFTGDGTTCADVDECEAGTDDCSENATCVNTAGAFTCTCNEGYLGNGVVCSDSCGDGVVDAEELCDDANAMGDDGCTTCVTDPGYICEGAPSVCASLCGNALVGPDEECDDGNSAELDGCTSGCMLECGDGAVNGIASVSLEYVTGCGQSVFVSVNGAEPIYSPASACATAYSASVQSLEELTDAALLSSFRRDDNVLTVTGATAGAAAWIRLHVSYLDVGSEEFVAFDFGAADAGSTKVCVAEVGAGAGAAFALPFIATTAETCDDGNRVSGDDCAATCATECGNSLIDDAENCDDGNRRSQDGCSASCLVEHGANCGGVPSICTIPCGDGLVALTEECDDGNGTAGDGCSSCAVDDGYLCNGSEPTVCEPACGNGDLDGDEECDDGNGTTGDGCSDCSVDDGYLCDDGEPSVCELACGNGDLDGDEECDDGNATGADGCSDCTVDDGYTCDDNEPSVCELLCGNGALDGDEDCDDDDTDSGDGCSSTCQVETGYICFGEPSTCRNMSCTVDQDIGSSMSASGNNNDSGVDDTIRPSCADDNTRDDQAILWRAPTAGVYQFRVDPTGTNSFNLAIALYRQCNITGTNQFACSDPDGSNWAQISDQRFAEGEPVLILVDGRRFAGTWRSSPWQLNITRTGN